MTRRRAIGSSGRTARPGPCCRREVDCANTIRSRVLVRIATTGAELAAVIAKLELSGQVVVAHVALRSFKRVDGGPATLVDAFLSAGCTLVMPTMANDTFAIPAPATIGRGATAPTTPPKTRALAVRRGPVFRTYTTGRGQKPTTLSVRRRRTWPLVAIASAVPCPRAPLRRSDRWLMR